MALIEYHVTSGGDPYGTAETSARLSYYATQYVPSSYFDGYDLYVGTSMTNMQNNINNHLLNSASMTMSNTGSINSTSGEVTTHIEIETVEYSTAKLRFALVEHDLDFQNNNYNYVCRDLLPEETLTITSPGQTFDITRNFTIQGGWNAANMDIVTFVQYDGNKHILQACMGMDYLPSNVTIDLTYQSGSPVPVGGGNLVFDVYVINSDTQPANFDAWLETSYAGGNPTTLVLRSFSNYQPGWMINRPGMFFPVHGSYAAGSYTFTGKVGNHPDDAWDSSSFPFTKSGAADGSEFVPFVPDGMSNPFEDVIEADAVENLPAQYALLGNYPNPFNPSTTICYALPEAGDITLAVFDINGRQLATVVDGYRDAGIHEASFDASDLSSGVYIYRLNAGDFNATGKMMLLK